MLANEYDAHIEWHLNSGVPIGTPGCPQDACHRDDDYEPPIHSFSGEFRFLSNFYPSPVVMYGFEYPTVEHAFQAAKALDPADRVKVRTCATPGQAKRMGRKIVMRPDWNDFRLFAMETLLRRKFEHPELRALLLATGDASLIEGNHWGDTFWGVCDGVGENHLGRLLMKIRREQQEMR